MSEELAVLQRVAGDDGAGGAAGAATVSNSTPIKADVKAGGGDSEPRRQRLATRTPSPLCEPAVVACGSTTTSASTPASTTTSTSTPTSTSSPATATATMAPAPAPMVASAAAVQCSPLAVPASAPVSRATSAALAALPGLVRSSSDGMSPRDNSANTPPASRGTWGVPRKT